MSERARTAVELFSSGYNCAQAVFGAVSAELGVDQRTALSIGTGFGGGMARLQKTCGAVTGAIMLLGLRHGMGDGADQEAKKRCYDEVRKLVERFEARHGSTECRALLGADLGTPEGVARAHEVCDAFVAGAVEIVEAMLFEQG
jgi:C_GCAxxG_C_C family probable redox protein